MAQRGQLTTTVQAAALRLLGREITVTELRLIPYVQHCIINGTDFSNAKVNRAELSVIADWRNRGHIYPSLSRTLACGRYFWDVMAELLWLSYADHENQPE